MPAPKEPAAGKPTPPAADTTRKPWKKKTAVEVFFDQESRLRKEVTEMEEAIKQKRTQLQKFEQARKLFEAS